MLGNRPTFFYCCLKSVQINKDYNFKDYKNRLTVSIYIEPKVILRVPYQPTEHLLDFKSFNENWLLSVCLLTFTNKNKRM